MKNKPIKVKIEPCKIKDYSFTYIFIGTHGQVKAEHEPKRYVRLLGSIKQLKR